MITCIDLTFWREIKSDDLLTYLALILAYIAYVWSVNRDLESWKSLFLSFKKDLEIAGAWIGGEGYSEETYKRKESFSPTKIIYPLSSESLPEIIRRGVGEFNWASDEFIRQLSLFNERFDAFNSALDHVKKIISANPILSEGLKEKLNSLGINNDDIEFDEFKKNIKRLKSSDEILYLAENIRRIHRIIHVELIGNKNKEDSLNYLYHKISKKIENILSNFDKKKPPFVKYSWWLILLSFIPFYVIELLLK
ncbi:MAG TPA: hypothetical protein PLB52_04350 [Candidatus Moranbacteria bacterium]|nr:hypothetical protein [Candidatus Moranbacteria bacterium]